MPSTAAVGQPAVISLPNGWDLEVHGHAQAGPIYSADGVIIDVDQPDGNAEDVAYTDENVSVSNGTPYLVTFRGRSATPRTVHIVVADLAGGSHTIGLSTDVDLTESWQDYTLPFTANGVVSGKACVALLVGGQSGTLQIAQAAFSSSSALALNPAKASVQAAGGLAPVSTWDLDTVGETDAIVQPSPTGAIVEIDRADGSPSHITLKQDGVALDDGKMYDLQFKAKASVARQIPVIAQVDSGPVRLVGLQGSIQVTPEWQDFNLRFTAVQPIPAHSRIAFLLGGSSGTVELSDVALQVDTASSQSASARE
jgi:hypothetical protein